MKKLHISQTFLLVMVCFVAGIGLGLFFILPTDYFFFIFVILILTVTVLFYRNVYFSLVILLLIFFIIGFWRGNQVINKTNELSLINTEIQGEVKVVDVPVRKSYYSLIIVKFQNPEIKVLVKAPRHSNLIYGDTLNLKCNLTVSEKFDDFDYRMYLATKHISYICDQPEFEKINHEKTILSTLADWRMEMENNINALIPAPQAALANGLIFGGDDRLSNDLKNDFSRTGMTHIVAVSGYNVTVIAMVIMSVAIFLGAWRKQAVWWAIGAVLFFVAIIGFPASGIRAAIMGSLVLVAVIYGRAGSVLGAICFSGAVMLFFNPLLLRYDVGFQLSFLATLGIILIYPIFENYLVSKFKVFGLAEIIFLTVSAQVFVLPIIIYNFHVFSNTFLLANILILPIIPLTMFFVFFAMVFSFVFWPLAVLMAWCAYFLLFYEVWVVNFLAEQNWSCVVIGDVNVLWYVLYYVILIEGLRIWWKRNLQL
ncbi:MAG: ComEC/Rec2 family competence protein [Candidatus Moranbacteria bacterium]|nr:ComEC/Rec2 family competence protein [Candidatus Moranbacteria bacterium]